MSLYNLYHFRDNLPANFLKSTKYQTISTL